MAVSVYICDRDVANKWIQLISVELFTLKCPEHQREALRMQIQSLTVNGPTNGYPEGLFSHAPRGDGFPLVIPKLPCIVYRIVEIIDSYERQIHNLKKELEITSNMTSRLDNNMDTMKIEDASPNFRAMIKVTPNVVASFQNYRTK